jgi:hypothetical protein
MSARKIRRAAEHKARKLARKAGLPYNPPQPATTAPAAVQDTIKETAAVDAILEGSIPEPGIPFPSLAAISPARLAANRANTQFSTGPKLPETRAISAQNHTIHGLARHQNGNFKLLSSEDSHGFEALKQSLFDEHQPATPTESILVKSMAESHWLASRAQRLQDTCMDPNTGAITDDKKFSLYMRYQTTHTRAFHKSLNDLLKVRAEKRKSEIGFEAQRIQTEKHEMKKQSHYWEVLKKDGEACHQISTNTIQSLKARAENPGFDAQYAAELAKYGLKEDPSHIATEAA